MLQDSNIKALEARLNEIRRAIEDFEEEAEEINTALRVIERYAPKPEILEGSASTSKLGPPRPEGTPTLFEMAEEVIGDALAQGRPGLKGREIVEAIGAKYWPGVQNQQVLPPIYGFAKKGRLHKTEAGFFRLAKNQESAELALS